MIRRLVSSSACLKSWLVRCVSSVPKVVVIVSEIDVVAEHKYGVMEMEFEETEIVGFFVWRKRVVGNVMAPGRGSTRCRMVERCWRDWRVLVAIYIMECMYRVLMCV